MERSRASGTGLAALLKSGHVPMVETLSNSVTKLDAQIEQNAKEIDLVIHEILKMVNELPNSKEHDSTEEAVEFLNSSNMLDKISCFDPDTTDVQHILKHVYMIMENHPGSEEKVLDDLLKFSALEGVSLPVFSSAYGPYQVNDSLASINAVVDASELQVQQQWDEICERIRKSILEKMSKLPVLTQQPEFGLDEFRYLNYVHSLLCLYPVADVWRDYKATRSKFIDRCIRELMPSLTEGVDINAVASNFNQLCDILLSVVNEDFLVFSTGVFKDVLTTFDAVSDTYLEKVSDELIGIIEYIHDATIQMDSTKLDIHKSKSDQGILSTLRGCRANSNSVKSLDALLSRSQEQLIDSPFSISFLHTLVKLVAACSRVEQHLRGLHNMGTWTPGLQSIRNLKSVLKVASDVPLQTQSSIDAFMGHQVTTFDSSAPSGSTENAIRSIHGPLFTWEWRLIFKKLVSDVARNVEVAMQEVTLAAIDAELEASAAADGCLPVVHVCRQLHGGCLDYPPTITKSAAAIILQMEQLLPLAAVGAIGVFYTVRTAFVDAIVVSLKKYHAHLLTICGGVPDKAPLNCLYKLLSSAAFIRNQLKHYDRVLSKAEPRSALADIVQQYSDRVDCIQQQLIDYHCITITTSILHDAESHDWASTKAFYEDERCSFSIQMLNLYLRRLRADLWQTCPPALAQTLLLTVLNHALAQLAHRHARAKPSYKRVKQFRSDITCVLLFASEFVYDVCSSVERVLDPVSSHDLVFAIHNQCDSLLATMAIGTSRIADLYRVFKKGFPNTKKEEEQGSRLVLSQESTTVEEERPVPHPAHWLSYIQPGVFIPYCSSVNQMQTTNVLYILLRLLDSQPQPNWSLLLQLLLFKDFTLPIMLLTLPADRLVAVETKPASCGGALCCGEECQSCSGQCANLFTPILHVLSLCYHLPEALAKVLEPVIDRANLWYLCDANVKPVELPELPPALQALYTLMEPFFNRVLEPGLRAVLCRSAIADSDAPNFWTPFSDLPCGCVNKQLFHHEDSKKDVLHVAIEAMLDAMVAALSTVPVSVCMFFARMQDLLRAHIQQPAHDSVGLQMLAAGLHYHLHIGSHLEKILGARINPAMQEKLNTLGECLYQLIIANPSSIRPRRPSEELAQGFILTRKDFLQSNIDSIKQFFGTFSLPKEDFYHDAPQEFADELLANMAGEILEAPGGNQSMHWVYYLLKNNMTWLTSQLDIPSLYPHADTTGIVASFNNSALPPDVSTEFNPLKEINMIGTGVFDQDAIASMPYDWQQLLQSDLGLSEVAFRQLLFNRHDMQEAAYLEEQEKKPVKVLRSLYEKDALELA